MAAASGSKPDPTPSLKKVPSDAKDKKDLKNNFMKPVKEYMVLIFKLSNPFSHKDPFTLTKIKKGFKSQEDAKKFQNDILKPENLTEYCDCDTESQCDCEETLRTDIIEPNDIK